jgi:hypothetical protein
VIPLPWSQSRLEDFKNCPRAFYEKQVAKSVVEEQNEQSIWGQRVHKHFEERLVDGVVLPDILDMHEPFLAALGSRRGDKFVEQRIALNRFGAPCAFFDRDVWFRGVVDFKLVNGDRALIVDHKTGKHHSKYGQLQLFAIHTFLAHPEVQAVHTQYYWTQSRTTNGETYFRSELSELWRPFVGDLKQYAEAFQTDTWQPRQSGLCRGWCPVTDCEFWQPKRRR